MLLSYVVHNYDSRYSSFFFFFSSNCDIFKFTLNSHQYNITKEFAKTELVHFFENKRKPMEYSLGTAHYKHVLLWQIENQLLPQGHFMDGHLFNDAFHSDCSNFFTDLLIDAQQDSWNILTPRKHDKKQVTPWRAKGSSQHDCRMIVDFRDLIHKEF